MQTIILPYDALLRHLRQNQLVEERGIEPRTVLDFKAFNLCRPVG